MKSKYFQLSLLFLLLTQQSLGAIIVGEGDYLARIVIPINSGLDDVEERPDGSIYAHSSDIELSYDHENGNQKIGLRFQNLPLERGATIVKAYLQFRADETGSDPANLTIRASQEDNASPFTYADFTVSQRNLTAAGVQWELAPWLNQGEQDEDQRSPDLRLVISEIINREGWEAGNALAFVITGNGTRTAEAYESGPNLAARLVLEVELPIPSEPITGLYINELMAANASYLDEFGEADDWVELYNSSAESINIGGLYLTDDFDKPDKWQIALPQEVPAGGFVVLWADDDDEQGGLHTSFKLSADGEEVGLFQKLGDDFLELDAISFEAMSIDISYGRLTDGGSEWGYFVDYSPAMSNNGAAQFLDVEVGFSLDDGIYLGQQTLSLSVPDAAASIHYTLDGKTPSIDDPLYDNPILLTTSTVVSARAFKPGFVGKQTTTGVYLIDESNDLFQLNIQLDPKYLWDEETGMYVKGTNGITGFCSEEPRNWNQDWEYPGQVTLFEADGRKAFKVNAGVKIGGGCSRGSKMKSFNFFLRKGQYGDEKVEYRLFEQLDIDEFKRFKVRNGGNDFNQMLFRDAAIHELVRGQMDMDIMAYRPVIVYLNGTYWGVYGLREFFNEDYIASHHEVDDENLDMITNPFAPWGEVKEGEGASFEALQEFIAENDLVDPSNYQTVADQIDINEFLNYFITQVYMANYDWPANNMEIWRDRDGGKWRWLFYDLDATTNYGQWSVSFPNSNTLDHATTTGGPTWPNGPQSTLFLRKLLENPTFQSEFIQRVCSYIQLVFASSRADAIVQRIQSQLEPQMERHISRWNNNFWEWGGSNPSGGSVAAWKNFINNFKQFFEERPDFMYSHVAGYFGLDDRIELTINYDAETPGEVVFHSNNFKIPYQYQGSYFSGVPIRILAIPKPGYTFLKWKETEETDPEIFYTAVENDTLTPLFVPTEPLITEVHYQPQEGEEYEFIEIHNATADPIDISAYQFTEGVSFTFPNNTILAPKSYAIIARNPDLYGHLACQVFQWTSGSLDNLGEHIQLVNEDGQIVDEVSYSNLAPWPSLPAGSGPSLHLIEAYLTNDQAQNWEAAVAGGTACDATITDIVQLKRSETISWTLYPNPVNTTLYLELSAKYPEKGQVSVLNLVGQTLLQKPIQLLAGTERFELPLNDIAAGVYLVKLNYKSGQLIQRIMVE